MACKLDFRDAAMQQASRLAIDDVRSHVHKTPNTN
jgi:hypothetical protein